MRGLLATSGVLPILLVLLLPGSGVAAGAPASRPPMTVKTDGVVRSLWQDGRLVWQARATGHEDCNSLSDCTLEDSLALIASWQCPGNTFTAGQLNIWDLNNNGLLDLGYATWADRSYVYEAVGDDDFRLMHELPNPYVLYHTKFLCTGDGDSDGLAEMVYSSGTAGIPRYLAFVESRAPGAYPDSVVLYLDEENCSPNHMRRADLDGDGSREYIGSSQGGTEMNVAIWENRGDNEYEQVFAMFPGPPGSVSGEPAPGDFDGDGNGDLVVTSVYGTAWVYVVECVGDDDYEVVWEEFLPTENAYWATPGPDLDRDGRGDFVITGGVGWGGDVVWSFLMYECTGDDTYELVWSHQVHSGMINGGSATGDIDGDGWPELLSQVPGLTMLFRAAGDNDLELCWEHWGPVEGQGEHRIIPPDLDEDSKGEAIWWLSSDPGVLEIYEWVRQPGAVPQIAECSSSLRIPSPFAGATEIAYTLSAGAHVRVEIFDPLGRWIATLANEPQSPGTKSLRWQAGSRSPGIYLCRFKTRHSSQTTKIVLTR